MKRSVLVLGLALLLSVMGATAVFWYVRGADARAMAGQQVVTVLIADQSVPAGTEAGKAVDTGLLRTEQMPADTVPAGVLSEIPSDLTHLVAVADIAPGQLVLRSMFDKKRPNPSGLTIPEGKVAVTVTLGVHQEVAGYVKAGSEVAVFDTYTERDGQGRTTGDGLPKKRGDFQATRVLLPKVEVLAVGGAPAKKSDAAGGQQAGVLVTVAVDQRNAERLILRSETGSLHLALLSDTSKVEPGPGASTRSMNRTES
ncbi:Flp pilus assembly protein CpaB [Nocardioides sp. NPDC051685]|uniref:Flp pilus assembly protein CpaB n=1 Tax=Nocardioides sp. NPDC051685 TaxID=3364334 RepID=UPI003799AA9E